VSVSKDELKQLIKNTVSEELDRHTRSAPAQPLEAHDEHILACPECFQSAMKKLMERSTVECEDCHAPLGTEEFAKKIPECPFCHGRKAIRKVR
jgi:hypothetical protein